MSAPAAVQIEVLSADAVLCIERVGYEGEFLRLSFLGRGYDFYGPTFEREDAEKIAHALLDLSVSMSP